MCVGTSIGVSRTTRAQGPFASCVCLSPSPPPPPSPHKRIRVFCLFVACSILLSLCLAPCCHEREEQRRRSSRVFLRQTAVASPYLASSPLLSRPHLRARSPGHANQERTEGQGDTEATDRNACCRRESVCACVGERKRRRASISVLPRHTSIPSSVSPVRLATTRITLSQTHSLSGMMIKGSTSVPGSEGETGT